MTEQFSNKKLELENLIDNLKVSDVKINLNAPFLGFKKNPLDEISKENEKTTFEFMDKYFSIDAKDVDELYSSSNVDTKSKSVSVEGSGNSNKSSQLKPDYIQSKDREKKCEVSMEVDKGDQQISRLIIEDTLVSEEKSDINGNMHVDRESMFKKIEKKQNKRKVVAEDCN